MCSCVPLSISVDATAGMTGRTMRLTQCNLLHSPPLPVMLLPTPAGVVELNTEVNSDWQLLANAMTSIHNDTFQQLQLLGQPSDSSLEAQNLDTRDNMVRWNLSCNLSTVVLMPCIFRDSQNYPVIRVCILWLISTAV